MGKDRSSLDRLCCTICARNISHPERCATAACEEVNSLRSSRFPNRVLREWVWKGRTRSTLMRSNYRRGRSLFLSKKCLLSPMSARLIGSSSQGKGGPTRQSQEFRPATQSTNVQQKAKERTQELPAPNGVRHENSDYLRHSC